jgi:excisionase family DNA binding protein
VVLSEKQVLAHISRSLGDIRRRAYANGGYWSVELEAIRSLADNARHRPTEVDADVEPGDCLVIDYDTTARRLNISKRSLERLVATGQIPTVLLGGQPRIVVEDLLAFVEGLDRRRSSA